MHGSSQNYYPHGGTCTAVIGSMTNAMKAQNILASSAVFATVIKVSSIDTDSGCAYGVTFHCSQKSTVRTVLSGANIKVRKFLG
ncbi:MAG: DUF3343 domain-containing protein [Ruminococcaceae bacterium]|nr:DUF3343 domain-containing protein [Oscillospiraceae bacterium]